jgi:hypothetical protein
VQFPGFLSHVFLSGQYGKNIQLVESDSAAHIVID